MRILVLINGQHTTETFGSLRRLLDLSEADLLLAYVRGPGPRAGLEMIRHRPGGRRLPPHRERELMEAEAAGGADAIAEATDLARSFTPRVEAIQLSGEPGRSICELAASRGADLVVVRAAGRDRPPIGPGSLGPTARFITDHSLCPVLLLRG